MLSQDKYDRLHQLEFSQISHLVTHVSSSGMNAYVASPQKSWILDLGASTHMTSIKQKIVSLYLSNKLSSVNIVDSS